MGEDFSFYKRDWILTQEAFDKLLSLLNPDRGQAGHDYETLRSKLITFFESHGCCSPEDHADISITRAAMKITEGVEISTTVRAFIFGVAKNVLHEYWRQAEKLKTLIVPLTTDYHSGQGPEQINEAEDERTIYEQELECLEGCIEKLSENNRELIIGYYQGDTSNKIKNRKAIARQLNLSMNSLRTKALRIRTKLEDCVTKCMKLLPGM